MVNKDKQIIFFWCRFTTSTPGGFSHKIKIIFLIVLKILKLGGNFTHVVSYLGNFFGPFWNVFFYHKFGVTVQSLLGPMLSIFTDFVITLRLYTSVDYAVNRKYFITRQLSVIIHVEKFVNGNIGPCTYFFGWDNLRETLTLSDYFGWMKNFTFQKTFLVFLSEFQSAKITSPYFQLHSYMKQF
jgi:hypothetical protein